LDGSSATQSFTTGGPAKWKGTETGEEVIAQMAMLVKIQTALRGRSHRGRIYLPWVSEGSQTAGVIGPTIVAAAQTAWTAFIAAMNTADAEVGVASYKHASWQPCTVAAVESFGGTQRRRQPRPVS